MSASRSLSISLALTGILSTLTLSPTLAFGAEPASRCVADLARVKNDFCLNASHVAFGSAPSIPLNYSWSLDDDRFDLNAKACLSSSGVAGERQDIVIALDRSRSMWVVDGTNAKHGTVSIASAKIMIEAIQKEAQENPERAAKIGLMLFSTDDTCEEYSGGAISVDRVFPCTYVSAASSADAEHIKKLYSFLSASEGKYSQGGLDKGSDYGIIVNSLRANLFELDPVKRSGLLLISDGRTYSGKANDIFAYLKSDSYTLAQGEALAKFAAREMRQYKLVFGLAKMDELFAGPIHKEQYLNMCALPDASAIDCNAPVNTSSSETWPVNKLELKKFAENLVLATGSSASNVIELTDKEKIRGALDFLRYSTEDILTLEAVTWTVDGTTFKQAELAGANIHVPSVGFQSSMKLELLLKAGAREVSLPLNIALSKVEATGATLSSAEMQCESGAALPRLSLKNLQGGSASCAVVGSESGTPRDLSFLLILLTPLIAVAFSRSKKGMLSLAFVLFVSGTVVFSSSAVAQEGGLNVLQYRPVIDGNGTSEVATPLTRGSTNVGIYVDYANDALELGVEKNKRSQSVVDDLVATHFVASYGVANGLSLGVHAPFVASATIDRETKSDNKGRYNAAKASDAAVFGKIKLVNAPAYDLGLMPIITVPSGDVDTLTGDGSSNYGMLFLISGGDSLLKWSANIGYLQREKALEIEDERARPIVVRGQYITNLGATWRATQSVDLAASFQMKTTAGEKFDFTNSNPSEWGVTGKYRFSSSTVMSGTFGTGIGKGYGSPDYRVVAGLAYAPVGAKISAAPKAQMSQNSPIRKKK